MGGLRVRISLSRCVCVVVSARESQKYCCSSQRRHDIRGRSFTSKVMLFLDQAKVCLAVS